MSKKVSYILGIVLTIIIGTIFYWYLCCQCCGVNSCSHQNSVETAAEPSKASTNNPLLIQDGDFILKSAENFNFKTSDFVILEPIPKSLQDNASKLGVYLKDPNNLKQLTITGYFSDRENNTSAYPNLGIARANSIKNYFVSQGVLSQLINTEGQLDNTIIADTNNVFYGPVNYKIITLENNLDETNSLNEIKSSIDNNPLVLHFETAEATIPLSSEQRQTIADISKYLDKVEGSSIKIIGHSDNVGSKENNKILAQNRADFVKSFFIKNGISDTKIQTLSMGETQPIATNDTEVGRAKNRRAVVTIN